MTPPTKKAKKAVGKSPKKGSPAAPKKKTAKPSAKRPAPGIDPVGDEPPICAGVTAKGAPCKLKAKPGSLFCARHSAPEIAPDAESDAVDAEAMYPPLVDARVMRRGERVAMADVDGVADEGDLTATSDSDASETSVSEDDSEEEDDEEMVLYGSVYSTTLEASPYDRMSAEMAEGAEEVELIDEQDIGQGGSAPRPQLSREDAEKKALEKLGPKPDIEPEEDLDGLLAAYDQRFEAEVRFQMGLRGGRRRRRRGRRGGRPRQGGPPPHREGGGWHGGGGGGGRRGRRGGRGGHRGGGGGGGGGRPGPGPGSKVARDSPLAQRRGSSGPKRGVQPRRRRDPEF